MNAHRPPGARAQAQALCLSCGLCCDGSLFLAVALDPAEPRHGDDGSAERSAVRAPDRLVQPCAHHSCGACAIYATRPAQCRAFVCDVLRAVEDGRRSRAWAEARIEAMRHLLAGLDDALPGEGALYGRAAAYLEDDRTLPDDARLRARIAVYRDMIGDFRPLSDAPPDALPDAPPGDGPDSPRR